jgi:MFS family permease
LAEAGPRIGKRGPLCGRLLSGWTIVLVCFLVLSVSFAARSVLGLSMPYLERDLGWTRSFISGGGAASLIAMAAVAPVAGHMIHRFGARLLLCAGLAAIAIGMTMTAAMRLPWQYLLGFGAISGIGFGMAATHAVSTIVSLRFEKNRGLAVGAATAGSTAGQLLVVPALAALLVHSDWRWSFLAVALASMVMAAIVLATIPPAGRRSEGDRHDEMPLIAEALRLFRRPVFHLLLWSYVICGFTTSGVIEVHMLPYAAACGFAPMDSAAAYGVLSAVNLGGMVLSGWLTDRMSRPLLLGLIYVLRGLAFILLIWAARDITLFFVFAVVFGLFDYSTVPVTASLAASHLGLRSLGLTMGLLSAGHSLGAAAGAYLAGVLYDLTSRYFWVWVVALGLALLAGLMSFAIGKDRRPALAFGAAS